MTSRFDHQRLDDMELLTVFVSDNELPDNDPNGTSWCVRAYSSLAGLTPIVSRDTSGAVRAFPMRPYEIEADYPIWEDLPIDLPPET